MNSINASALLVSLNECSTLSECVDVLNSALVNYKTNYLKYCEYPNAIYLCKQSNKIKKSLLLALHKLDPHIYQYHSVRSYWSDCSNSHKPIHSVWMLALNKKDYAMFSFMITTLKLNIHCCYREHRYSNCCTPGNTYICCICNKKYGYTFRELGANSENNSFVIKILATIPLGLAIKKAFLYGAITTRNMQLIQYIVEHLKIPIHIPTEQKASTNALIKAFIETDDLELLKWFINQGYNPYECGIISENTPNIPRIKSILKFNV